MQCYHHPGWDAWTQCSRCKEPLCYECAMRRDGYFLCNWCFALENVSSKTEDCRFEKVQKGKGQNFFKRRLLDMLHL
jgi:hypothetical protein